MTTFHLHRECANSCCIKLTYLLLFLDRPEYFFSTKKKKKKKKEKDRLEYIQSYSVPFISPNDFFSCSFFSPSTAETIVLKFKLQLTMRTQSQKKGVCELT